MKRILVAPLDWGLGHAARCIPLIRYLSEKNCEVILGGEGRAGELLKKEFPSLEFINMPGYYISYPGNGSMALKMALQVPKILKGIRREHAQLQALVEKESIDGVISDNRFGLWSTKVPCVFITHQLMVKSAFGERFIHRLNKQYISKFTACWVPDVAHGLSGDLSNKFPLPANAKRIGLLSRFERTSVPAEYRNDILVILSGPEPQRSLFEKIILAELEKTDVQALVVQGITEKQERKKISDHIEMVSHLTSAGLEKEIVRSKMIVSRPGYSTVMDLAVLGRKAIFVPTPGQTEQEYLAKELQKKKIACSAAQDAFDLKDALERSQNYSGFTGNYSRQQFREPVDEFILSLA